jgi:hypothetical protein
MTSLIVCGDLSGHYDRRRTGAARPVPPPAPAPSPRRQFGADGVPRRIGGRRLSANGRFIGPFIRIQTPGLFSQPVPFFRGPGAARDPLQQVGMPAGLAAGGAEHLARHWSSDGGEVARAARLAARPGARSASHAVRPLVGAHDREVAVSGTQSKLRSGCVWSSASITSASSAVRPTLRLAGERNT